ncbi:hypothetical protein JCM10212_002744 [Sporobolomyces blumeae]
MTTVSLRVPTTLVLDFHDSYTRNVLQLVQRLGQLPQATDGYPTGIAWDLADWKERVVVVNVDSLSWEHFTSHLLPCFDCIILGPGPGTPHSSDDFCWATRLITEYGGTVPIFGLCLGCQGLATSFGGKVGKALAPVHGQISQIHQTTASSPLFDGVPSVFSAVQYNSLVVDEASLAPESGLRVIARSERGEVMALEAVGKPLWGVQFHPESICSTFGSQLLSNFFRLSLSHLARFEPSPNLPSSVLSLSTTTQRERRSSRMATGERLERRTVRLGHGIRDGDALPDPQTVFETLVKGKGKLGEVWLESARPTGTPQFSHLFNPSATQSYTERSHSLVIRSADASARTVQLDASSTVFDYLSLEHNRLQASTTIMPISDPRTEPELETVPVGFVGYIGYEMKHVTMPLSRPRSRTAPLEPGGTSDDASAPEPGTEFAFANRVLSFAHETGQWYASGLVRSDEEAGAVDEDRFEYGISSDAWTTWIDSLKAYFASSSPSPSTLVDPSPVPLSFVPDQSRDAYIASIDRAREQIVLGNAYELCLTTQFRSTLPRDSPLVEDPYSMYLSLRKTNPAPYSAYFHLPLSDLTLMSSSPERFLRQTRDGQVSMKPIKGTVRRCLDDRDEDERRKATLEADEKERAENLMIVDLIRNDLLGFCEEDSVEVPGLMKIETYETVHQMVTTVVGQIKQGVTPFDAVSQAFPPGSMTGAPKLRSLQLLDSLERGNRRGIYSGVFGYVSVDGASDWSVVIRTLIKRGRELTLGAGGAITHLSDPAKEWEEVLTKIEAVLGKGGRTPATRGHVESTSSSSTSPSKP